MPDKVRISTTRYVARVNDGPEHPIRAFVRQDNSVILTLLDGTEEHYEHADIGNLDQPERCPTCRR